MKKRKHVRTVPKPAPKGTDEVLEVEIERILPGGAGLAHVNGQTVLVGLAAAGDRLRVRVDNRRRDVAFASIVEIIEPSPSRAEPPCPYFGRCGGCDFQQLSYEAQLAAKVEIIRDCFRRIAHLDFKNEIPITPSPNAWHYRSSAQWQFDSRQLKVGYFERGTHNICDVVECPILSPALGDKLSNFRARMREGTLPRDSAEFQVVAGDQGVSISPPIDQEGTSEVSRIIAGDRYVFSANSFFQINHELLPALIAAAIGDARGDNALDFYCGAGLFTLPLARRFKRVIGVEAHSGAVTFARRNLTGANLNNAEIECAPVGEWLANHHTSLEPVDFLLLDPPRTGVEKGGVEAILDLHPQRISYVSCDPATLARDLRRLIEGGYSINSVAAFDMFPQTHHVETVVHLET